MKAEQTYFLHFLEGTRQFSIPIFQRPYSWEKKQCERLWRDIMDAGENQAIGSHFLGSIVFVPRDVQSIFARVQEWQVIDGQQRLATLSLLLSALSRAIEENECEAVIRPEQLSSYLFNVHEEGKLRYKQLLTQYDKDALIQLLEGRTPVDSSHRLVKNYRFFESMLKNADTDLGVVCEGIQKLQIVAIKLERSDNPQVIFDCLNSTGLSLTEADRIRNYVLMREDPEFQNRLYDEYWSPMEKSFDDVGSKAFNLFMGHYLTLKTERVIKEDGVYDSFKVCVPSVERQEVLESHVAEIVRYSKHYACIVFLKEEDSEFHACFKDIRDLGIGSADPFLLGVYDDYARENIGKSELIEVLRLVESYLFRRVMCEVPSNTLNKTFAGLMRVIDKNNYLESLKKAFLRMSWRRRYPSNREFKEALQVKNVGIRRRKYLLRKLENYGWKEPISVSEYTIEHVMPQTLTEEWQRELGANFQETHETYLHTLGNLTLTGYNPELSNRSFRQKQDMEGGFRDSPLRLNRSLAEAEVWNEDAIRARAEELAEKALQIWVYPEG